MVSMSNSSAERIRDLSFLYSRSEKNPKCLFTRYLQTPAAQVLYVCIDIYGGWYKCLFRKCYYPLTPHICQEFSAARMQQNWKVFPPTPSGQTERMGFFTLHTKGSIRLNIAKVATEPRNCKRES